MSDTTLTERTSRPVTDFDGLKSDLASRNFTWMTAIRETALSSFERQGVQTARTEDWRNTNLAPLKKVSFSPVETGPGEVDISSASDITFAGGSSAQLVFVNGRYSELHSRLGELPEGVKVCTLAQAVSSDAAQVERHLAQYVAYEAHPFAALNTAFMEDGAYISVPESTVVESPIQLLFFTTGGEDPIVTHPRNLIVVGRNSQVRIIETYASAADRVYLTNAVTEIVVGPDAIVDHYKIQRESENAFHLHTVEAHQERSSNFSNHAVSLGGALARNDINCNLDGERIECTLNGLYLPRGTQHMDTHTRLDHAKPHCNSHESYKGILDDKASGVFNGKILVRQDAQKTDAVQSNHSLLLTDDAKINTRPQLEIFADDVRCTHGATIGELDEDGIFYMRTRGIDHEKARALMISAFATEVVDRMPFEPVRERIQQLIAARFQ